MEKLEELIIKKLNEKFQQGEVEKLINEALENMITKILKDITDCWSEPYKALKVKFQEAMCKNIEEYDYSNYIIKFTDIVDEVLKMPSISASKKLAENFKEFLSTDDIKEITLEDIFKKYCDFVEDRLVIDHNDCDYNDEGKTCVTCIFEKDEESYSGQYLFKVLTDKKEEVESFTFSISIYESYKSGEYVISLINNSNESAFFSLKNAFSFQVFLMNLKQNYTHITNFSDYLEEDVYVDIE